MKLLLDTHVWVWSQLEPERLGAKSRELLLDTENTLLISTVSTLEIARLVQGGRIVLSMSLEDWVRRSSLHLGLRTIKLSHAHAIESYALPSPFHRDPADRMLVATTRVESLILLTADQRILEYSGVEAFDACA